MQDFTELYSLLGTCYFSFKRNTTAALNQGETRGLSVDDVLLIEAFDQKDEVTIRELSTRASKDMASVSRQVTSLVTHGWIRKRRAHEDARVRFVQPTDQTLAALPTAKEHVNEAYERMMSRLSLSERRELVRMLRIIADDAGDTK